MLVVVGRTRWVRVSSRWSIWGGALLFVAGGCGSRTSAIDQEAYLDENPMTNAGVSNTGGSPSQAGSPGFGGTPALPIAGGTSMPTPTAGQSSGPTDAVVTTCQKYCSGYAVKCPGELMGQNCQAACEQEMSAIPKCTTPGIKALRCLTPFFKDPAVSCDSAIGSALTKCNTLVSRFQKCKGVDPAPQPQPQPQPMPQPNPVPTSCPGVGEVGPSYCRDVYSCPNGSYSVSCELWSNNGAAGGATYNCTCSMPNGGQGFMLTAPIPPCQTAAQACGFTTAILK